MIDSSRAFTRSRERDQTPTQASVTESRLAGVAHVFLAGIGLWLVILGLFNLRHPSDWAMGDWLINYSGGFVRRGLTGQIALCLHALRVPPLWTILLLQWVLYAVVLLQVWHLVRHLRWNWWRAALFFSPATLAFVLLDPPFAYRKDILFFALLALTLGRSLLPSAESDRRSGWSRGLLLTLGCAVCVLSHEGLIVFFPYLLAALYLPLRNWRRSIEAFALPATASLILFAVVSRFPGNGQVAAVVCSSIGGTLTTPPSGICGGAIDYLTHNSAYAHREVARVMLDNQVAVRLLWLFVLPLVPVVLGIVQFWRIDRPAARALCASAACALPLSFTVLYYGPDWTRWIYIHVFSLTMLMLYAARQQTSESQGRASVLFAGTDTEKWTAWAMLLTYCLGWELSVYGQRPLYGSFVRFVTHNMARGQQ